MTNIDIINKLKQHFGTDTFTDYNGFIAIQVNLTTDPISMFYIEVKEHHLAIEPYDYYDHNALLIISPELFLDIINKKVDPIKAATDGMFKIEGNPGILLELIKLANL